jgi:hypothetical protein
MIIKVKVTRNSIVGYGYTLEKHYTEDGISRIDDVIEPIYIGTYEYVKKQILSNKEISSMENYGFHKWRYRWFVKIEDKFFPACYDNAGYQLDMLVTPHTRSNEIDCVDVSVEVPNKPEISELI